MESLFERRFGKKSGDGSTYREQFEHVWRHRFAHMPAIAAIAAIAAEWRRRELDSEAVEAARGDLAAFEAAVGNLNSGYLRPLRHAH